MAIFGIVLGECQSNVSKMVVIKNIPPQHKEGEQEWENPQNPEKPADARDKEQLERQYKEAKRRKGNLSETDHIDKEKKN